MNLDYETQGSTQAQCIYGFADETRNDATTTKHIPFMSWTRFKSEL